MDYSNGRYHGFVDVGSGVFDDAAPMAKDAFVLIAVCVNGSWKISLGYFLINGLGGAEKANVVEECFERIHQCGVTAVSLTCDGHPCHFAMMRELGATVNIVGMYPSFHHPSKPSVGVYLILDMGHML